jgi:hypothetical protein
VSAVPDYALVYGNPARLRGWMCAGGISIEFSPTAKAQANASHVGPSMSIPETKSGLP